MADEQAIETPSGLKYVELLEGMGALPRTGEQVSVHYTGWLTNGTKFDSSHDRREPIVFPIGKGHVIKGWDEGVGSMKVGGKRKLIIPAHLGYGDRGAGGVIPPGATLIFEVELVGITS
jgi:peptidylprolyl isomerase